MKAGYVISGAGHAAFIVWLLFGNVFAAEPPPLEVTEVTMITGEEWAALVLPEAPPDSTSVVEEPEPPEPEPEPEPQPPEPEPEPQPVPQPQPTPEPEPEPAPDVSDIAQPPAEAEVQETPPEQPQPPAEDVAVVVPSTAPEQSLRPRPRPADRVAPTPVAQPEQDTEVSDAPQEATTPDETTDTPAPEQDAAQPEETTTEIVTEAEEPASAAPTQSLRPVARPERVASAQPEPETAPASDDVDSVVADLLEEATAPAPAPSGPPLSRGETEAFRIAVQECWNVDVGSQAADVVVTVGFSLSEGGVVEGDVRLISAQGGTEAAQRTAYQSARRAVLRCQRGGYDLPVEKYDQWREIEMTFNPESMRVR